MMTLFPVSFAACLLLAAPAFAAAANPAADQCSADLQAIPPFLMENDTGARQHVAQKGQQYFDLVLAKAAAEAAAVVDAAACDAVLERYVGQWRKGHLHVRPGSAMDIARPAPAKAANPANPVSPANPVNLAPSKEPSLTVLSDRTVLLTLPSFNGRYRDAMQALLARNHETLATRSNWILDVRDNGGGSDSTYAPLLPWLLDDEVVQVGAEWLATPANIEGQQKVCGLLAPGDKDCEDAMQEAVQKMRSVKPGEYVAQRGGDGIEFIRLPQLEPRRPARVAVLVDRACGSSCEEFLLLVRQSFHVKLVGRNSFGALDYSNLRLHALPSGLRHLQYATSRSRRLPHLQVDLSGIMPDIYLPPAPDAAGRAAEVTRVQRWLEGGSLKPL